MNSMSEASSKDDTSYEMDSYSHSSSNALPNISSSAPRIRSVVSVHCDNDAFQRSTHSPCEQPDRQNRLERIESNDENVSDAIVQREQITGFSSNKSSWYARLAKFWTGYVCPSIDQEALRDHLGTVTFHIYLISCFIYAFLNLESYSSEIALERTFLGYLRTSLALATTGVFIAQLFRLQPPSNDDLPFSYFAIGRPLSVTFISMALVVIIIGAIRFWRLQSLLVLGKSRSGGWEVLAIMASSLLVSSVFVIRKLDS